MLFYKLEDNTIIILLDLIESEVLNNNKIIIYFLILGLL